MDSAIEDNLGDKVSPRPVTAAVAAVDMLSCSSSEILSETRRTRASSTDGREDLQIHVEAVQHGHRGLETALGAMCNRLLDLEGLVAKTHEVSRL